jgi:hypothetical protein
MPDNDSSLIQILNKVHFLLLLHLKNIYTKKKKQLIYLKTTIRVYISFIPVLKISGQFITVNGNPENSKLNNANLILVFFKKFKSKIEN